MAVTYAYPTITPELQDLLIGTEIASVGGEDIPKTRTFTVQSILDLISTTNTTAFNSSITSQSITAATVTYLVGSSISTSNIKAGTIVTWNISVTKTAAGVVAPVFTVRLGTTGSVSDLVLLTFTGSAQTAVIDNGVFTIKCVFRSVGTGTSAVLFGDYSLVHNLQNTGLSVLPVNYALSTSSGFNSATANSVLGVTVDSGTAASWTINQVSTKIENLE